MPTMLKLLFVVKTILLVTVRAAFLLTLPAHATDLSSVVIAVDDPYVPPVTCRHGTFEKCIIPEILATAFSARTDQLILKPMSTSRHYLELGSGNIQGAIVYTTPRLPKSAFPASTTFCPNSLFDLTVGLYTSTHKNIPTDSLDHLFKYRMAVVRLPAFQRHMLGHHVPNVMRTNNLEQVLKLLIADRADYTMYENYSMQYRIQQLHAENEVRFVKDVFEISYHLALSTPELTAHPELIQLCDQLDEMKNNGTIQTIIQRSLASFGFASTSLIPHPSSLAISH